MPAPNDPAPSRMNRVVIAVVLTLVVIAFVVVHLTGVIGSGAH
jgi:hypothetical protein